MRNQLQALLDNVHPEQVIYEGYAMGAKGRVFHIGELGGVFAVLLYEQGISVAIIPPTCLKQLITGKGNADKAAMAAALQARYGVSMDQDDEADAYALLMAAEHYQGLTQPPAAIGKSAQALKSLPEVLAITPGRRLQPIAKGRSVA